MGFKGAFKCERYTGANKTPCDCPCWTSIVETNITTGEVRSNSDCVYRMLPSLMVEVIKAANRPAASIDATKAEIAAGFKRVAAALSAAPLPPLLESDDALPSDKHAGG